MLCRVYQAGPGEKGPRKVERAALAGVVVCCVVVQIPKLDRLRILSTSCTPACGRYPRGKRRAFSESVFVRRGA